MKTITAFLLAVWMAVCPCYANPLLQLAGIPPAVATCSEFFSETAANLDAATGINENADKTYTGIQYASNGNRTVCRVTLRLKVAAGSVSSIDYHVRIYSLSGTSLNTLLGTSDVVSGSTISSAFNGGDVDFDFTTPVSISNGTSYGIVVRRTDGTLDGSNYAALCSALVDSAADLAYWEGSFARYAHFSAYTPICKLSSQ